MAPTQDAEFFAARADIVLPAGVIGPEPFSFDVQAFVVRRGNEIAVVDTLMNPDHSALIEEALAQAGAGFADIGYVVLTHHHPDHTGGLVELARRAPQARLLAGAADVDAIARSTGVSPDPLDSGGIVMGLEVIATPGHTPGHLCLFDSPTSTMLLGDLAGNYGGLRRPPTQFTLDAAQAESSLSAIAAWEFEIALPSHGEPVMSGASRSIRQLAGGLHPDAEQI